MRSICSDLRLVAIAIVIFSLSGTPAAGANQPPAPIDSWLAYGHDAQLTNFVPSQLLSPRTAPYLADKWTTELDGAVVASPLYASGVSIAGQQRDVALFETEAGSIYALDPRDGTIIWHDSFGTVTTPDDACGSFGFSSTPAIDEQRGVVYAVSADGHLHALDLATGAEATGWPIDVTSARNQYEYVWAGLRLLGDTLYVGVSSYCDQPGPNDLAAEGRLVAIDVQSGTEIARFDPVPGYGNLGGIWGWGGVSITPDGSGLFTGVGNAYVYDPACNCHLETVGYGNAMVRLTPSLVPVASNRPQEVENTPPGADIDFGAAPLLFQPPGCPPLAAANNKLGNLYIWQQDDLGAGPLFDFRVGDGVEAFVGQPAYSPWLGMLFDSHAEVGGESKVGDGIAAFEVGKACKIHRSWLTSIGLGNEPPPIVIGDTVVAAAGDTGGYVALDGRTGKLAWSFSTGSAATWSPPIAVGDEIFAGDMSGNARAFGLLPHVPRWPGPF
ncbi:MAG TPA: PQQ-binding-like beta-propeller repeat protein [Gaiellaceae bacterium]